MKTEKTNAKIETDTEMLARMMMNGFEKIDERFEKMEERLTQEISSVKQEISSVKQEMNNRFEEVDAHFDEIDARLTNINIEQKETNHRLDSIEKKQLGTILSLDETVHRNEFNRLTKRVEVLEK